MKSGLVKRPLITNKRIFFMVEERENLGKRGGEEIKKRGRGELSDHLVRRRFQIVTKFYFIFRDTRF